MKPILASNEKITPKQLCTLEEAILEKPKQNYGSYPCLEYEENLLQEVQRKF